MTTGKVYLVGGGPGDPSLLTLKGQRCLQDADLVLYDGLVNPLLLLHTRATAERTSRVAGPNGKHLQQDEINRRLIAAARQGKTVVRLKGGDPFIFGRGTEEATALREAEIPFEVVPGITAAVGAGAFAGISFTHRQLSSAVAFVTGHEDPEKPHRLDYAALAAFPGTLVFYMGLTRLPAIVGSLREHGLPADTPACVVSRATTTRQRTVSGHLSDIAERVAGAQLAAPSLIVVGPCATQHESLRWFEHKPLFGTRIGVTRAARQAGPAIDRILDLGGEPVLMPLIETTAAGDSDQAERTFERLQDFAWLAFTSANGVRHYLNLLRNSGRDARSLAGLRIAAVGPGTAEELSRFGLTADLIPDDHSAAALADAIIATELRGPALWPRGRQSRETLQVALTDAGLPVEPIDVYETRPVSLTPAARREIESGAVDWIALSSPSTASSLADSGVTLPANVRLAAISPLTAAAAVEAGLPRPTIADTATWDGLIEIIVARANRQTPGGPDA